MVGEFDSQAGHVPPGLRIDPQIKYVSFLVLRESSALADGFDNTVV